MKKKGIVVATIVMMLVLAVSLSTATYAWFTTSSVTKLGDFDVSVAASNFVNIGFSPTNEFVAKVDNKVPLNGFVSGDVTFTKAAENGQFATGAGTWSGTINNLSATVNHDINWGAQRQAIAVSNSATLPNTGAALTGYTDFESYVAGTSYIIAANGDAAGKLAGTARYANENITQSTNGADDTEGADYIHFVLGVSPTQKLESNTLIIFLSTLGDTVGMNAAVHVAYRTIKSNETSASAWEDIDLYGTTRYDAPAGPATLSGSEATSFDATFGAGTSTGLTGGKHSITLSALNLGDVDQIEIVIYIYGNDTDCNDFAKNSSGTLYIFFDSKAPEATQD